MISRNPNITTVVGSRKTAVVGGKHVFDHTYPEHRVTNGAFIKNMPAVGNMIYEGDLGYFDYGDNTVEHLKVFVPAVSAASGTEYSIKGGVGYQVPEVGQFLMVSPDDFSSGKGKAYAISSVVKDLNGNYTVTVASAIAAVSVNDTFTVAAASGSAASPAVVPNVAFTTDIYVNEVPATAYNSSNGFRYYTALYDICALLGRKLVTPVPAGARVNLRKGFSNVLIVE